MNKLTTDREAEVIEYCADISRQLDEGHVFEPDARLIFIERVCLPFLCAMVGKHWTDAMTRAIALAVLRSPIPHQEGAPS